MAGHNSGGGICHKPRPREGPGSTPFCYCSACGERIEVTRWNARARVACVEPCSCQQKKTAGEVWIDEFPPQTEGTSSWVKQGSCLKPAPPDGSWWCCTAPYPDHDDNCPHKPPKMDDGHLTDRNGEHCWCNPDVEEQPNGDVLVIHKSREERS
jgi:hypothetical protein